MINFRSLHIKVSLSVAAAALLVVLISSQAVYRHSYHSSFAESDRSLQQLLETVRATAAIAAYVGNRELAQQVVGGLVHNDIVSGARILAVDIPSGIDCDTGQPLGPAVRANHTVTFVGIKAGFLKTNALPYVGTLHFADIGAPRGLVEKYLHPLP